MIKNYFIAAFRNFARNKSYTLINVTGLSVGVTACIVIFLLIMYEASFDTFHTKCDNIYRVFQTSVTPASTTRNATIPYPFVNAFRNDFPDVPLATQIHMEGESMLNVGGEKLMVDDVVFADSLFFEVFDFKIVSGNPRVDLGQPGKVFLTESLAERINKNGDIRSFKINNVAHLEIAGIIADPPSTSHLSFSMLVSFPSLSSDFIGGLPLDRWGMSSAGICYVVLPNDVSVQSVEERLKDFVSKYLPPEDAARKSYSLQPLGDIHFNTAFADGLIDATSVQRSDLMLLGVLATFIIVIACINFINLTTALSIRKSKEVGIRKTLGAGRFQLTGYVIGETLLITLIAVIVSLCLTEWLLPWLNPFLEKKLDLELLGNYRLVGFLLILILFVVVCSGVYPAAVISRFSPVTVLKTNLTGHQGSGAHLRKMLVIFQFMLAQILIIGTLVISDQMEYFRNKPLGFDKDAVITVVMPENKKELLESFRTRMEANPDIVSLSYSVGAPLTDNTVSTGFGLADWPAEDRLRVNLKLVDRFFLNTYGLRLKAGRWFNETDERLADDSKPKEEARFSYIINESAMRQLGFNNKAEEIIGTRLVTGLDDIEGEIIGVVEDFHVASLHETIGPVVLMNYPFFYYYAGIKVNPMKLSGTVDFIRKNWTEIYPDRYFNYEFLDDYTAGLYRKEEKMFTLFKIFSGISIFVGCLGLYGLISFVVNQKVREVGIRKVMGASVVDIVSLFSKEFVKLIIVAFILAAPVAWYFMTGWLEGFAYHVNISWTVFFVGLSATIVVSFLTVSYRSVKAAMTNPVETLRVD